MTSRVVICRATPIDPDPRVEKIAHALKQAGYNVRLIGWDMSGEYPQEEYTRGLQFYRCRVKAQFGRGLINMTHQIRWQIALLSWLMKHRASYDIVHACDFDTVLPALLTKWLWGKIVIYDIFDFYADMLRATPGAIKRAIRFIDLKAINRVDAVILADDSRGRQIAGSRPKRVQVIYNCPEDLLPSLQIADSSRPEGSQMHITYVGNLQIERGLLLMVELLRHHPEWTLDLAGFGADEAQIVAAAQEFPNITWHGRLPYESAMRLSQTADVLLATYDPALPNHRYASPNKVFEALMLGKPIIVARDTNVDSLIEENNCGLVVEYGDPGALEAALLQLQKDPEGRNQLGENARRAYEATYNWANMASRLIELYQEVVT